MTRYDTIVLGIGGVGSAALYHLAGRGQRVIGLDRFQPGHDRGSSHGRTRIIRRAYYEHPNYVPLANAAYGHWAELERIRGEALLHRTGLLQVGPADGEVSRGVIAADSEHHLQVEELSPEEIRTRWPGFAIPDSMIGLFEPGAGYLNVEACVVAHVEEAQRRGAEVRIETAKHIHWQPDGGEVAVETALGTYRANRLIITTGAWARWLLRELAIDLEVRRKPQYWFAPNESASRGASYRAEAGYPAFLYETPQGIFYGFPVIDDFGLKVAMHSGGTTVEDPLHVDRGINPEDLRAVESFLAACLPEASHTLLHHSVCMYTMSPDGHFIVDRHPEFPQTFFAAGLSGHGFKFTGVLGQALSDLATDGSTDLPIGFLNCGRPGLRG